MHSDEYPSQYPCSLHLDWIQTVTFTTSLILNLKKVYTRCRMMCQNELSGLDILSIFSFTCLSITGKALQTPKFSTDPTRTWESSSQMQYLHKYYIWVCPSLPSPGWPPPSCIWGSPPMPVTFSSSLLFRHAAFGLRLRSVWVGTFRQVSKW